MGQGNSRPLTRDECARLREYSVYIAILLAVSHNRSRSRSVVVDPLPPQEIVAMVQKQSDIRAEQETHRLQMQASARAMQISSEITAADPRAIEASTTPVNKREAGSTASTSECVKANGLQDLAA